MWEKISPKAPFVVAAAVSLLTIIPIWYKFKIPQNHDGGGDKEIGQANPA
jgi:hypothetical protein